jgi:hypothetical protein
MNLWSGFAMAWILSISSIRSASRACLPAVSTILISYFSSALSPCLVISTASDFLLLVKTYIELFRESLEAGDKLRAEGICGDNACFEPFSLEITGKFCSTCGFSAPPAAPPS